VLKRAIIIAAVIATAMLLQFLQNKVLVGEQELNAEVRTPEAGAYAVVFKDVAGNPVDLNDAERGELLVRLKARLAGNDRDPAIAVADVAYEPGSRQFRLAPGKDLDELALRQRVQGRPFHRPNEAKGFWAVNLGIDLRGGVEFTCRLKNDEGKVVPADDEVLGTLRSRLDERGLTEPALARLSNGDVQIVIPGGTRADAARTRKVLETTGRLEFREDLDGYPNRDWPGTEAGAPNCAWVRRPNGAFGFAPGVYHNRQDVLVPHQTEPGLPYTRFFRLGPVAVAGKDVADAYETMQEGQNAVGINFTAIGAGKNHEFTTGVKSRGDAGNGTGRIAITFEGEVVSNATVISPSSQSCVISGRFTKEEIDNLRTVLKAGALSVTPEILSERVVGSTLGHDEISRAVTTMLWCMSAIVLFLIWYYRRLGFVALSSMVVCATLTWTMMAVFGATLTLPGIAGLILSIAMSIDTNVLIYERIREELREDKGLAAAIEAGYDRVFLTVIDSHLTTMATGLVLWMIGSGPVKGFGLTLIVGVGISLFSGIYVGRLLTDFLCRGRQTVAMSSFFKPMPFGYVRLRFVSYALTALTAIAGIGYFAFGHKLTPGQGFERNFEIEFTGGTLVQVSFQEPVGKDAIDTALQAAWAKVPEAERGQSLLNPAEIQKQAYFANLAQATSASRQWVFRVRDVQGAGLEAERAGLEAERGGLLRELTRLREAQPPDVAAAKKQEKERIEPLSQRIREVSARISDRTDAFKRALGTAFAGKVAAEGDEVRACTWADRRLAIQVATLEPVSPLQADEIARRLTHLGREVTAKAEGQTLTLAVAFADTPKPGAGAVEAMDAVSQRCAGLLAQTGAEAAAAKDLGAVAGPIVESLVDAAASQRVVVAQPFPASQHFSGQVADRMKWQALIAVAVSLIAMMLYIAARFEMSYGLGATVSLLHVVVQTVGMIALFGVRIDLTVIAGVLTVIGYAINDTIVLYDRIRENVGKMAGRPLADVIDRAVSETMPRTILTGGGVIASLIIMLIFAGDSLHGFCATLLIGTLLGTYSSVFVAAPLLLSFKKQVLASAAAEQQAQAAAAATAATEQG
jgi:SecD/SecF fusion protein